MQRQSNAVGAARNENAGRMEGERSARIRVTAPQRTELHEAIVHDSAIRVYHQGDVHFAVRVGARIPDTIEFYAPLRALWKLIPTSAATGSWFSTENLARTKKKEREGKTAKQQKEGHL